MATRPVDEELYAGVPGNDDELAQLQEQERQQRLQDAMAGALGRLQKDADERVRLRKPIEIRWIEDSRAFMGFYDTVTEQNLESNRNRSKALINLIRSKTNLWDARLGDLLFPADDKNYGVGPTPVPELADQAKQWAAEIEKQEQAAQQAVDEYNRQQQPQPGQPDQSGQPQGQSQPPQQPDQNLLDTAANTAAFAGAAAQLAKQKAAEVRAVMEVAEKRAAAMAKEIDDQLVECNYPKRCRDAISDGCRLGPGIIKGPLFSQKATQRWRASQAPGDGGQASNVFELQPVQDDKPEFVRVSPWAFFPDPNATCMEESESEFERHLPNKSQLRRMARELGFYPEAVRDLLTEELPGYASDQNLEYLTMIRNITGEGQAIKDRFVVWEYHGPLEADEIADLLEAIGQPDEANRFRDDHDPLEEIRVILYFCNGKLLKLSPDYVLDSGETLYSVWSFEKSEGSILGAIGVPRIMLDAWRALNAAWRMMLDNGGISAGPQIVIDKSKIAPENGDYKLASFKVWEWISDSITEGKQAPFEVFNIPINQEELAGIIQLALQFIEEEVALPQVAQGNGDREQGTQTLGGTAILTNAANAPLRRVVKNWDDDITVPSIRRLYDWNMQFNPKEEIKGDMQVEARGTSALLVREIQSQHFMNIAFNWTTHPVLGLMTKEYDAAKLALQSLSINSDDVLRDEDTYEQRKQDAAQAQQQSPEQIAADASIKSAQILADSKDKDGQVQLQIAQIRERTEGMKLVQSGQITMAQLDAMLTDKREQRQSTERMKAVEIAVENQRAKTAEDQGEPAAAATGKGIG
jgi:hypothetical protein